LAWAAGGVLACVLLGLAVIQSAQESAPPTSVVTVTVAPGDTLWGIAERRYPGGDTRAKVSQIERLNDLSGPVIVPGDHLQVPGP
jgi:LysM repeat protein